MSHAPESVPAIGSPGPPEQPSCKLLRDWRSNLLHCNSSRCIDQDCADRYSGTRTLSGVVLGRPHIGEARVTIELQINNSNELRARYVSWAPSPCKIRLTNPSGVTAPVTVTLSNAPGTVGQVLFYSTGDLFRGVRLAKPARAARAIATPSAARRVVRRVSATASNLLDLLRFRSGPHDSLTLTLPVNGSTIRFGLPESSDSPVVPTGTRQFASRVTALWSRTYR
jgi:hypothetical protein